LLEWEHRAAHIRTHGSGGAPGCPILAVFAKGGKK